MLILGIVPHQAFATDITASVDRNPVSVDESFKIFFTATDSPDSDPNFAPLEQDFSIINQGQSSSSSWVNGKYSKSIRWTVEVTAKKPGNLFIPPIQFGSDASKPLAIVVNQGATTSDAANTNEDLILDVNATPEQPYVQSQVLYTIRLYRRVDVAQAELSEPELADAVIEKLGEDSSYNTLVNGVSYLVTERKYAIFPQKSGVMKIKPLSLTAAVIVDSQPDFRDFFGSRMTKTRRVLSKEIILNVKPVPPSFTGKDWLAAEKLELKQEWSGDIQQMKIGEPLTRTLTLRGVGTTVGQLPELSTVKTDADVKAYPDQPVLNERKLADGITASRQEKIALIPTTAGKHVLPAIEIPWFNTKSQTMEIVRIPETTINVVGVNENQPDTAPPPKTLATPTVPIPQPEKNTQIPVSTNTGQQYIWFWISVFLALGWLATAIYFLQNRPKNQVTYTKEVERLKHETGLKESAKKLKNACANDDAQGAKNALLAWGKQKFNVNNLGAIADCCDARLRDEILHLNQVLYGKDTSQWTGKKLMQVFTENKAREKKVSPDEQILEPLHRL
ncbi:BatD family protein [Methyloglobulus sp.]|uniref:BatD family protein n=1 Tax=Methyloglobulus sp. TaxID=2518622 RepID=UPI00398A07E3